MKKRLIFSAMAIALLAPFSILATPLVEVNSFARSVFHPATLHLSIPGLDIRSKAKMAEDVFGICGIISEYGSEPGSETKFSGASQAPSDLGLSADIGVPVQGLPLGNSTDVPRSHIPSVPEPSSLAMLGLFLVIMALRSRWATWHR